MNGFRTVIIELGGNEEETYRGVLADSIQRNGPREINFRTRSGAVLTIRAPYRVEREKGGGS